MVLLHDILAWSQASLKPWQQDAVRRLFQHSITADAIEDLYAMLKDGVGLLDPQGRKPQPLVAEHLPVVAANGDATILISMGDVRNVNRLAPQQVLQFSPKGMTVIYGTNGAGKSGYARVLKRACRARDVTEDVRANAFEKPAPGLVPQAEFKIQVGGNAGTVSWSKNKPAPAELATIAVFDTHCARAYLDHNQDIAYLPSGLDVVENLAQVVMPKLLEKLSAEIQATDTSKDALAHMAGNTKVGKLVNILSENTPPEEIESLAMMGKEDVARMETLGKTLAEADPEAKATQCRLAAGRMAGLKKRIDVVAAWVKDEAVEKLRKLDDETLAAIAAEAKAAGELRAGEELLPGTGDAAWKVLYEAAREFSIAEAYPEMEFPHAHDGAKCVLCQQELENNAGVRLARFEKHVQESVAKVAQEKREQLDAAVAKITGAALALELDDALKQEVSGLDPELPGMIESFDKAVLERQTWLLGAQKSHSWEDIPTFPADPRPKLEVIAANFTAQAEEFDKATDDKQKALLKAELGELSARAALGPCKQTVLDLVNRMRVKALLTKCKDELKTKPVSDKAKAFASSAVTAPLRAALKEEFEALGVSHAMPRLDESVERGKMKHKLQLDLAVPAQIRDILSEGEQRAIAVGAFLAELVTGGHSGGIVFDDPVSSLDHIRRQHVARRLVKEAAKRQVIIFTHDTTFLGELNDLLEQHGTEHAIHHLFWEGAHSGKINAGLPWHHQTFKDRIDKLEQAQKKLEKSWPPYPDEEQSAAMRTQYSMLRATIERLIQDLVFNGVVVRYRDWIKVGNLGEVVGFDDADCKEIERLHKACCDVTEAHDPASGKNAPVPNAQQLGAEIAALAAVAQSIKSKREAKKKAAKGGAP
ncbi:AAA family ATPase [Massilia dura]|uniref:AAA family ATPase n=1 Tax=Pseudoduganella dura TaxID=321982 RepID=A0A6I3XG30_9BURK|nr:AAA family ATPase [Pseudoduganella dura]MUI13470.1 AAA family ATPase [Pseudoduganella dura]